MIPGSGPESASGSLARPPAAQIVPNSRWPIVAIVEQNRPDPEIPWVPLHWRVQLRPFTGSLDYHPATHLLDFSIHQFAIRLVAPIPARVGLVGRIAPDQSITYRVVHAPGITPTDSELAAALEDLQLLVFERERANQVIPPQELLGRLQDGLQLAYSHRNSIDANWWALQAVLRHTPLTRSHVLRCLRCYAWTWRDVRDYLRPAIEKQGTKRRIVLLHHAHQRGEACSNAQISNHHR